MMRTALTSATAPSTARPVARLWSSSRGCGAAASLAASVAAAALVAGCGGHSDQSAGGAGIAGGARPAAISTAGFQKTDARGKRGGSYMDAGPGDPKTFNIILAKETTSTVPLAGVFDSLVIRNPQTLEIEPSLAESFSHAADGRTWTFKLRPGLKWSDGQPFTAADVVFTLDVIYDPKVETTIRELLLINKKSWSYKKLDDRTIQIVTPTPFGPFLDMVGFPIMPKHKLESAWKGGQFNSTWGVNAPPADIVGTGPFVIDSYKPSENITFKRNPYYWKLGADGKQLPFLDGGAFQLVPDVNTLTLKFRAKELDFTSLRPEDWDSFRKDEARGDYKTMDLGPDWGMTYISFNQNPRAATLPAYKREWFSKKEFRQAVAYAIDRDAMVKTALRGLGRPLWSPVSEANKLYFDPAVKRYPYDPQKSRALLSSIGLSKTNADGILEDAAGHPVEFTLITNSSNNVRVTLCTMIQSDLKKIGMKVDVTPVDFNALTTRLTSSYDWEAHLLGFTGGPEPYGGKSIWTSPGIHHLWNPRQSTPATPWEAEIDRIFAQAGQTVDPKQRAKLYNRWQEIAADEAPLIFLVTPDSLAAVRNRLNGLKPTSLGIRWNEYEWSER